MKTKFLLALAALFVLAASTSAEEKLSKSVAAEVSVLNDARELEYYDAEQLALDLTQKYIEALTNTKNSAQKAGKLETLMAAENEIKRVNSGTEDQKAPQDKEVLRLKTAYTDVLATRRLEIDQKRAEADRRHAAKIDLIVANLTKQGKIDEAKLVLANKKPITKVSPPAEKAEVAGSGFTGESQMVDLVPVREARPASLEGLAKGSAEEQQRQLDYSRAQRLPLEVKSKATGIAMRLIPPGTFTMGSPPDEPERDATREGKQVKVTLSKGFYVGKFEVTQREWEAVMGGNPSVFKGAEHPVEMVSWSDC